MLIKHFIFGPIETNCYLVACEKTLDALVIDPDIRSEEEKEQLFNEINKHNLKLKYIVNTHNHFDHTGGNAMLKHATGAKILIHELDAPALTAPPADKKLDHDDVIDLGETQFKVIHTPGHSPGGICLYVEKENVLFSGDTLFNSSIGRTDLAGGSYKDIIRSGKKLLKLPENTIVYTGHGPATTIDEEKRRNPYLQPAGPS